MSLLYSGVLGAAVESIQMIAKIGSAIVLLAASAWPLAAEPFHHPFGEWREYNRDWLAACPDVIDESATDYYGFSCFASTGTQELNAAKLPAYKLTIFRNRLTGELDLAITIAADAVEADTSRPMLLAFGGEPPQSFDFGSDLETRFNTTNQFYIADPVRRDALLELVKARNSLMLKIPTSDGSTKEVWLSLRGVNASIDFMATYARKVAQY